MLIFQSFEKLFNKSKSVLSVALKPMINFNRYGSVTTKWRQDYFFNEKKYCEAGFINGGIYILRKEWLIKKAPGKVFSFEKDILEKNVKKDFITSYISDTYFIDIGIPEDYMRALKDLPDTITMSYLDIYPVLDKIVISF